MLPFAVPGNDEQFQVTAEISVPRYGCLTVSEAVALDKLLTPELRQLLSSEFQTEFSLHFRSVLVAVLLISRYDPAVTLSDVEQMPLQTVVEASNFLLSERDGSVSKSDEMTPSTPTDWAGLFWKIQRHYPHEPRFKAESFGNCPTALIEQALDSLEQERLQQLSAEATALSLHGHYTLSAQGVKTVEPDWFNPWQRALDIQQARAEIPEESARVFLELSSQNKVPAWAVSLLDIEKIRRAA